MTITCTASGRQRQSSPRRSLPALSSVDQKLLACALICLLILLGRGEGEGEEDTEEEEEEAEGEAEAVAVGLAVVVSDFLTCGVGAPVGGSGSPRCFCSPCPLFSLLSLSHFLSVSLSPLLSLSRALPFYLFFVYFVCVCVCVSVCVCDTVCLICFPCG